MTWAEFRIRLFAYKRQEKERNYWSREIAYNALIGSHVNPKKLPKSREKFISLEGEIQSKITKVMMDRILEVKAKYNEQIKGNG